MRKNTDTDNDDEGSEAQVLSEKHTREENLAVIRESLRNSKNVKRLRESIQRRFKFDMFDKKAFPVMERNFSWDKVREKIEMREADSSSAFAQVLRAGIQVVVNGMYETVPTTFEEWVHVVPSSRSTELYAPLQGIGFPGEVARQGIYPETGAAGLDIKLKNRKYGQVFAVEEELLEDDQTGEFRKQVNLIAKYLKQVAEVVCYGKLASVANMKYANLKVRRSETKPSTESNYPWTLSSAPFVGGGYNKASPAVLSQPNIEAGMIAQAGQKNMLGLTMGVDPNRILASHKYRFTLAVLLRSAMYPTDTQGTGSVGQVGAVNPIQGLLAQTFSRFMFDDAGLASAFSKAWYIVDDSVPWFVLQMRAAAEVVQENPQSGESFNRDVTRFKGRTRLNADHIDPRFAYQGSDGSV